jgi:hypothetical protein
MMISVTKMKPPPKPPAHPGKIEMVNADTGESHFEELSKVPPDIAFVDGVPVVKIVSQAMPDGGRQARYLSADGTVLRSHLFVLRKR